MSGLLQAATTGGSPDQLSGLLGPGTTLSAIVAAAAYFMREWRLGRQQKVTAAEDRASDAEKRADTADARSDIEMERLRRQVESLSQEVSNIRAQQIEDRREHADQLREAFRRNEKEIAVAWRLREWIVSGEARDGKLPPDLDPERPDVPPNLNPYG